MAASDDVTDRPLTSEAIPTIDLRLLSQSELYSLSLCSSSALNPHQNEVVIPKIDPTIFNKSAASRKQTYSPVRLARRRTRHLKAPEPASPKTERAEDSRIVAALRALFSKQANPNGVTLPNIQHTTHIPSFSNIPNLANGDVMVANPNDLMSTSHSMNGGVKRKRGRPRKDQKGVEDGAGSNSMNGGLMKRKRGRPRKEKGVQDVAAASNSSTNGGLKRKRGRPRKDRSMPASTTTAVVVVPESKNEGNENQNENDKEMVVVPEANLSFVGDEEKTAEIVCSTEEGKLKKF